MNLNLPKVAVPDRVSLVQRISANERITFADLEGPGCIRHIWSTAGGEGNGRQLIIRIYFDEEPVPHIEAPFGDFFRGDVRTSLVSRFPDQTAQVDLKKGRNVLVLKLSNTLGTNYCGWAFAFRATLPDGGVAIPRAE